MTPAVPLPTDNLYKFCALIGVTLCVLSIYYCLDKQDEFDRQYVQATVQQDKEGIELEALDTQIGPRPPGGLADLTPELREQIKQRKLKQAEERATAAELRFINNQLKRATIPVVFGVTAGLGLATYGFRNWRKLQLIQDQILEKQRRE